MKEILLNNDKELLHRIKNGDEVAFELVFHRYKGFLLDFVRKSLPKEEDAEGLVQEVFVKLWTNRHHIEPSKSLNAFLFTIARNQIYDRLRKLLSKRKYLEELYYSSRESDEQSEKQMEYDELKEIVDNLVEQLPEKRREIFVLSREEGLSYREIAIRLGISENTVDSQIRKALSYLKENLQQKITFILFFLFGNKKKKHRC